MENSLPTEFLNLKIVNLVLHCLVIFYIIADMAISPSECLQSFYFRLVAVHGYMRVRFAVWDLECSENNCVDGGVRMQTVGNLKVHFH